METPDQIENNIETACPSCGGQLIYSAEHKKIHCGHCGYTEEVDNTNDKVVEQSLSDAIHKVKSFVPEERGKKVFDCGNCGAKFMVEATEIKVSCGFCGSRNVNVDAYEHQFIQPMGIIPFYVSRDEGAKLFNKWIKKGIFHPNKLKRLASLDNLHGVYIPFWTYDAMTHSSWSGEAGQYYNVQTQVRINGRMQTKNVQQIRWSRRSGRLDHFFDDILVVASGALKQNHVQKILPFRLEEVVNFDPRLMVGWEAEVYKQEVDEGYREAELIMDHKIRNMCSAQLGGDTQRNLHVNSSKDSQTFKHIILPIWIASYVYNDKIYHFTINGQTGRVSGKKPISYFKIAFCVFLFALFIFGLWYLKHSGVFDGK